ncbi:TPA: copper amine oxidase, partial [Streptococcus pyogenes]
MKKFNAKRLRAFFMALLLVLTSTSTTNVLAKADDTDGSKKVIESSISNINDLEDQIKDLNEKKQKDQSKIDEL